MPCTVLQLFQRHLTLAKNSPLVWNGEARWTYARSGEAEQNQEELDIVQLCKTQKVRLSHERRAHSEEMVRSVIFWVGLVGLCR